jgi:hypothetical protein
VRSAEDLRRLVEQHKAGTSMLLLLKREGSARYLIVQV